MRLLLFPFNGNALEAVSCLGDAHELVGFVDDEVTKQGKSPWGHDVFDRSAFARFPDVQVLAVPGSPTSFKQRAGVIRGLGLPDERFATVVHPSASVSGLARLGRNVLVMAGVVVTSNAVIGDHVCILPNSVIHHDVRIGDYTLVGSNVTLAGHVTVGENAYVGSGTSVINNVVIGDGALIGLGTSVLRDVPADAKHVGNPGRTL